MTPDVKEEPEVLIPEDIDTSVITDMSGMIAGDTPLDGLEINKKA